MRKIKRFFKNLCKQIVLYCSMPHVIITVVIIVAAIITGTISFILRSNNAYVSSLLANICAGLVTGVVLCLVSTTKSMSIYRTECIINWLKKIHDECMEFKKAHHALVFSKQDAFENDEELYNTIYDVLCLGNAIDGTISQSQFDNRLPFNPTKYCHKKFGYDVISKMKKNDELRDKVLNFNVTTATSQKLNDLFADMDSQYFDLNKKVLKKIAELETKLKELKVTII